MDVGWWALIVSLGSLGFAAANYWRGRVAKPYWATRRKVIQELGVTHLDRRWFIVQNRGRGDALDVTLDVVKVNGQASPMGVPVRTGRWETVAFGESAEIKFVTETGEVKEPLESGDTYVDRGSTRTFLWGDKPEEVEVIVTWSEHPNTRKRRQRTYTIQGDFTPGTVIDASE